MKGQRILLVYPRFPTTFWGLQYALDVLGKKALMPPLGLLTIAAMCPAEFELRLVDQNCRRLTTDDIDWADAVFMSAMLTQRDDLLRTADRCRNRGRTVVFGGPFPTGSPDACRPHCDVLVVGEAESVWSAFVDDLQHGALRPVYASDHTPDVTRTPIPRFDLCDVADYLMVPVQFSRGCPYQCEFCDIIVMFGRTPRTKTPQQLLGELDAVRATGFRGEVFIVDDNFIGNKARIRDLLPALEAWSSAGGRPFRFGTEASLDLARHDDLLAGMTRAGFRWVFLGIETPSIESLRETRKVQNTVDSLETSVGTILRAGLYVSGGFIIGFDADGEDIFERQLEFIRRTAIPFAMVGLLEALPGTPLYDRLQAAGRLDETMFGVVGSSGLVQAGHTNIRTALPTPRLLRGYRRVIETLFDPANYFQRAYETSVRYPRPVSWRASLCRLVETFRTGMRFFPRVGAVGGLYRALPADFRHEARRLVWRLLLRRPDQLGAALDYIVVGYHLHRFAHEDALPQLDARLAAVRAQAAVRPRLMAEG